LAINIAVQQGPINAETISLLVTLYYARRVAHSNLLLAFIIQLWELIFPIGGGVRGSESITSISELGCQRPPVASTLFILLENSCKKFLKILFPNWIQ